MVNKKQTRSLSPAEKSLSDSVSDSAIRAGWKAKQVALKTVKSLTTLLKKSHKPHVVASNDEGEYDFILNQTHLPNSSIADTDYDSFSMMDIDPMITHTSSEMDLEKPISISEDDHNEEEKIIKETDKKISK